MSESKNTAGKTLIVGIGASAGGLEALKQLFSHVPGDSGLAFVVVVHLAPDHPSLLADLLQPFSAMPVLQITEDMEMEPNQVYVIPPESNLSNLDSHLRLSRIEEQRIKRAPIDHFFETLAEIHGGRCIGVVLSGTGSDGSIGIRRIKERGGLTLAQDPNEASFDGMPQNAIATGLVDLILSVHDMPEQILRFARTRPRINFSDTTGEVSDSDRQSLQQIFAQVRARTDMDFTHYKRSTVLRRIRRRMQLHQTELLEAYLAYLRDNPNEAHLLAEEFLITVTQFFRDADTFRYLKQQIVPALFAGKTAADSVRVWSVGCATGEEAYSIAMLLLEQGGAADAFKLVREELRLELRTALSTAAERGASSRSDPIALTLEGKPRQVVLPYRSTTDPIQGVVITLVVITQIKLVELALRNSEERYRALVTTSAQTVWSMDADGQVIEDSPSWRAYTGQTYEQYQGTGWLDAVHPEDRAWVHDDWQRCLAVKTRIDSEYRLQHVSGTWRWTQMRARRSGAGARLGGHEHRYRRPQARRGGVAAVG